VTQSVVSQVNELTKSGVCLQVNALNKMAAIVFFIGLRSPLTKTKIQNGKDYRAKKSTPMSRKNIITAAGASRYEAKTIAKTRAFLTA